MKRIWPQLLFLGIFLFSCTSKEESAANDALDAMQFENYYQNSRRLYNDGNGYLLTLKGEKGAELATHGMNGRTKKISMLDRQISCMEDIDASCKKIISEIHKEKSKILEKIGSQSALGDLDPQWIYPARIDATKIKEDSDDAFDSKKILSSIIKYRDEVVKLCTNSHYRFVDGSLKQDKDHAVGTIKKDVISDPASDSKYFYQVLEDVFIDDKETLFEILVTLTPRKGEDQKLSAHQALHFLSVLESRILMARKYALGLLKSRVSADCYSFDKILSLAYGPSHAQAGEEIEIKVLIAAFNSQNDPEITCAQGSTITVNEGVATLRAKIDKTTTYNGTISIQNKSGAVKTHKWEVVVPVLE